MPKEGRGIGSAGDTASGSEYLLITVGQTKLAALFAPCPFNLSSIEWYCTCSHSPLAECLGTPIDSQLAEESRFDPELVQRRITSAADYPPNT